MNRACVAFVGIPAFESAVESVTRNLLPNATHSPLESSSLPRQSNAAGPCGRGSLDTRWYEGAVRLYIAKAQACVPRALAVPGHRRDQQSVHRRGLHAADARACRLPGAAPPLISGINGLLELPSCPVLPPGARDVGAEAPRDAKASCGPSAAIDPPARAPRAGAIRRSTLRVATLEMLTLAART